MGLPGVCCMSSGHQCHRNGRGTYLSVSRVPLKTSELTFLIEFLHHRPTSFYKEDIIKNKGGKQTRKQGYITYWKSPAAILNTM